MTICWGFPLRLAGKGNGTHPFSTPMPLAHPHNCVTPITVCLLPQVTKKAFQFPKKHELPFYFVSAADGTNVVKVRAQCRPFYAWLTLGRLRHVWRVGGW